MVASAGDTILLGDCPLDTLLCSYANDHATLSFIGAMGQLDGITHYAKLALQKGFDAEWKLRTEDMV